MNFLTNVPKCDRMGSVVGVATSPKGKDMNSPTGKVIKDRLVRARPQSLGRARPRSWVSSGPCSSMAVFLRL